MKKSIVELILAGNKSIKELMQDPESEKLLVNQIAKEISDRTEIISQYPKQQLISVLSQSKFAEEQETERVAEIIYDKFQAVPFPFPYLSEQHKRIDWAERCLVGLGMFWDFYQSRFERRAAPKPQHYAQEGIRLLEQHHEGSLARNFQNWINFLRINFPLSPFPL